MGIFFAWRVPDQLLAAEDGSTREGGLEELDRFLILALGVSGFRRSIGLGHRHFDGGLAGDLFRGRLASFLGAVRLAHNEWGKG